VVPILGGIPGTGERPTDLRPACIGHLLRCSGRAVRSGKWRGSPRSSRQSPDGARCSPMATGSRQAGHGSSRGHPTNKTAWSGLLASSPTPMIQSHSSPLIASLTKTEDRSRATASSSPRRHNRRTASRPLCLQLRGQNASRAAAVAASSARAGAAAADTGRWSRPGALLASRRTRRSPVTSTQLGLRELQSGNGSPSLLAQVRPRQG
jgi:hypothetical protein